jgi:hypothetical protein
LYKEFAETGSDRQGEMRGNKKITESHYVTEKVFTVQSKTIRKGVTKHEKKKIRSANGPVNPELSKHLYQNLHEKIGYIAHADSSPGKQNTQEKRVIIDMRTQGKKEGGREREMRKTKGVVLLIIRGTSLLRMYDEPILRARWSRSSTFMTSQHCSRRKIIVGFKTGS